MYSAPGTGGVQEGSLLQIWRALGLRLWPPSVPWRDPPLDQARAHRGPALLQDVVLQCRGVVACHIYPVPPLEARRSSPVTNTAAEAPSKGVLF